MKLSKKGQYYYTENELVVVMHNLKGYDGHFIIKNASKYVKGDINVIAQSFEKYNTMSFNNIKFIDSMNFMK